jgi:multisubunit Na+/H+ antiporter MnhF subunit
LFLIQAAVTALIIHQTSFSTAYNYDQILPLVAIGLGILGSIALSRYFTRKGQRRGAAASADRPGPA